MRTHVFTIFAGSTVLSTSTACDVFISADFKAFCLLAGEGTYTHSRDLMMGGVLGHLPAVCICACVCACACTSKRPCLPLQGLSLHKPISPPKGNPHLVFLPRLPPLHPTNAAHSSPLFERFEQGGFTHAQGVLGRDFNHVWHESDCLEQW